MTTPRTVLVTGGNRGIGRAIAEEFVSQGHRVAVTVRSGEGPAGTLSARTKGGGGLGTDFDLDGGCIPICHSLRAAGFDASEDGTGRGTPLVPEVLAHGQGNAERVSDGSPSLTCNHEAPIGFIPGTLSMAVRRITPRECERLQGFPDDYTLLPGRTADGPRYKALTVNDIGANLDLFIVRKPAQWGAVATAAAGVAWLT